MARRPPDDDFGIWEYDHNTGVYIQALPPDHGGIGGRITGNEQTTAAPTIQTTATTTTTPAAQSLEDWAKENWLILAGAALLTVFLLKD